MSAAVVFAGVRVGDKCPVTTALVVVVVVADGPRAGPERRRARRRAVSWRMPASSVTDEPRAPARPATRRGRGRRAGVGRDRSDSDRSRWDSAPGLAPDGRRPGGHSPGHLRLPENSYRGQLPPYSWLGFKIRLGIIVGIRLDFWGQYWGYWLGLGY